MSVFIHPQAICESKNVGDGTRVWAFAHILAGAKIGSDCNICDAVYLENIQVGDRVTIKNGAQVPDGVTLEDDVFIGPGVVFTNDLHPRSKNQDYKLERTLVCKGASIGAHATILSGLTIGRGVMVGAGAVVIRSVPDGALVVGNPARVVRQVNSTPSS